MNIDEIRARLLAERDEVLTTLRNLDGDFEDIVTSARDSNLDDEHDPEGSTIAVDRSMVSAISQNELRHLEQIDSALQRLDNGSYGVCTTCAEPIAKERLAARPEAGRCIKCH